MEIRGLLFFGPFGMAAPISETVSAVLPIHFVESPQWTNIIKCFHVGVFKDNDVGCNPCLKWAY